MKKWILAILIGIFIMRSVGLKSSDFKTINGASIVGSGDIALTTIGGIGGSTGATDNRVLRADGTGGATLQSSGVTIDDTGNITAASFIVGANSMGNYGGVLTLFSDGGVAFRNAAANQLRGIQCSDVNSVTGTFGGNVRITPTSGATPFRVDAWQAGYTTQYTTINDYGALVSYLNSTADNIAYGVLAVGEAYSRVCIGLDSNVGFIGFGPGSGGRDAKFVRSGAGQVQYRGDNGLAVKNLAGNADAPLTASTINGATVSNLGTQRNVVGTGNTASSAATNAFGASNTASGSGATAFGINNTANNTNTTALGRGLTVSGSFSVAVGNDITVATGNTAAFGWSNTSKIVLDSASLATFPGSGKFTGSTITYGTNSHTIVDNGANGFYMTVGGTVCFQIGASGNASFVGGTGIGFGPSSMAANNYLDVSTAATFKFKNAANSAGAAVECASLTLSGGHNLAPITKASLLASTPNAATGGRWRVTDSSPANQEAYPDGSAWRWAHDNSAVV